MECGGVGVCGCAFGNAPYHIPVVDALTFWLLASRVQAARWVRGTLFISSMTELACLAVRS